MAYNFPVSPGCGGLVTHMFPVLSIPKRPSVCCPPVVINLNLLCGTVADLPYTLQLPPHHPASPTGSVAFADHQAELRRVKPSTCSQTEQNYRPLPARLPSQPHPRMHRGSLLLPSPSGCWHPVGRAARARLLSLNVVGTRGGRSHVDFVKLKPHHVTPQRNVPAALQAGGPIRLEEGKTGVTGCPNSLNIC